MSEVLALVRAHWLVATSYRFNFAISLAVMIAGMVPIFFVANAIQPVVSESIRTEGGQYFGFLLVGMIAYGFMTTAVGALPNTLGSDIASGTLEAQLNTPARLPMLLLGMCGYSMLWTSTRTCLMALVGVVLGASFAPSYFAFGIPVVALIVLAYVPFGLLTASFILVFRTATPLNNVVLMLSMLLGGVYYSTSVIPSWMGVVSNFVPLTYGLRALRRVILEGMPLRAVSGDLAILLLFVAVLWTIGLSAFVFGLRYARRAGTLSHY